MAEHLPYYGHEQGCYNSRIPWGPEPCLGCVALRRAFSRGQRDEREAIDAEITADLTARIQREREDRDPDLLLGGIDYALQNVLRVIRARGES